MPKNILFWPDVYKEQGHWLPTFVWAQGFHDDGDTVHYMGIEDCRSVVESYDPTRTEDGLNYTPSHATFPYHTIFPNMYPLGYTTESHTSPSERWKPWHIWAILYSQFESLADIESRDNCVLPNQKLWDDATSFKAAWAAALPNLLVSGYFTSLETLLIYWIYKERAERADLHFAISTTFLRHPQDDPAVRALQNLQAFSKVEQYQLVNLAVYGIFSFDEPEISLEDFVKPLEEFDEFVPCPSAFDYSHYTHADLSHYVEPCITKSLDAVSAIDSDGQTIDWNEVLNSHENIIFATAGSQVLDYEDKARNIFHSMCKAMQSAQMKDYFLIIGAGYSLTNSDEWTNYSKDNLLIANWIPQRSLLAAENDSGSPKVKCALIHGGLATIKECIYFKRNFVIIPLGKDQIDNALRLQEHKFDNVLNVSDVTPNALLNSINKAMTNYRTIAALNTMSSVFKEFEDEPSQAAEEDRSKPGYKALKILAYKVDA